MPNFTTGEWKYEEYVPNGVTINGKEYIIYTGSVNPKEPGKDIALARREADARLIAAAPEMYDELYEALQLCEGKSSYGGDEFAKQAKSIRELLARIDGKEDNHD